MTSAGTGGGSGANEGAASVLRAVGSLLVALSGGDDAAAARLLNQAAPAGAQPRPARAEEPEQPPRRPAYREPSYQPTYPETYGEPLRPPRPDTDLTDDVDLLLADARTRAQRILDESMDRARDLVRRERAEARTARAPEYAIDPAEFDDLRRSIRGLVTEVRDVQRRLARIEALLEDARLAREAAAPAPRFEAPPATSSQPRAQSPSQAQYQAPPPVITSRPEPAQPQPVQVQPATPEPSPEPPTFEAPAYSSPYQPPAPTPEPAPPVQWAPEIEVSSDARGGITPESPAPERAPNEPRWPESPLVPPAQEPPTPFDVGRGPQPAPAPPRSGFSVVPPQRREWSDEDEPATPSEPAPIAPRPFEDEVSPPPMPEVPTAWNAGRTDVADLEAALEPPPAPAWPEPTAPAYEEAPASPAPEDGYDAPPSGAPIATFMPSDGAIILRVTPVAGFQGLMRLQDALARLPAIRQAAVESYSQGEARLRLELADTTDSEELADSLGRSLHGSAHVEQASEADRELLIALQ